MKAVFPDLAGNESIKNRLGPILLNGSPSHAYIIEGPAGSGKSTFAVLLAAALSCEAKSDPDAPLPCCRCNSCRKILSGISPDVIVSGPGDKSSVGVDTVRDIRSDVHIYPNELEHKIYIVDAADSMTLQAQNAFLLTLEEPPSYAVFLLLCENAGALLETVRSRAPVLRMQPLSPELLEKTLLSKLKGASDIRKSDPQRFNAAIMSSGGSVGKAMELLSSKEGAEMTSAREGAMVFVEKCVSKANASDAMNTLIKACANSRETASTVLHCISAAVRDLTVLKLDHEGNLLFYTDREHAADLSDRFPLKRLLSLSEASEKAAAAIDRSMNVRLTLMCMLADSGII